MIAYIESLRQNLWSFGNFGPDTQKGTLNPELNPNQTLNPEPLAFAFVPFGTNEK